MKKLNLFIRLFLLVVIILGSLFFLTTRSQNFVQAVNSNCPSTATKNIRTDGTALLSTSKDLTQAGNIFYAPAKCVLGPSATIPLFEDQPYNSLLSTYFTKSKLPASQKITLPGGSTQTSINLGP